MVVLIECILLVNHNLSLLFTWFPREVCWVRLFIQLLCLILLVVN